MYYSGLNSGSGESTQPLLGHSSSIYSDYSTTVVRHPPQNSYTIPSLSSILTIRPTNGTVASDIAPSEALASESVQHTEVPALTSVLTIDSYATAPSSGASIAAATEGGSTLRSFPPAFVHRFTLIKPGAKRHSGSVSPTLDGGGGGWSPLDFFFSSGLLGGAKCDICQKRLRRKPVLECDDCGLRYGRTSFRVGVCY